MKEHFGGQGGCERAFLGSGEAVKEHFLGQGGCERAFLGSGEAVKEHFLGRGGCERAFVGAAVKEDFWPRFAPRGMVIVRYGGLVFSH